MNLDGHCEFVLFLENDFYCGIQDCDLFFLLLFFFLSEPANLQEATKVAASFFGKLYGKDHI